MEKVITIIAEIAVAALVLAGVVLLTTTLMDADGGTTAVIYNSMQSVINTIFEKVKAIIEGMTWS